MIKTEGSIIINRPVQVVFDYLKDVNNSTEWMSSVVEARQTGGEVNQVGATYEISTKFLGKRIDSTYVLADFQPNRSYTTKIQQGPVDLTTRITCESAGDNATRVTRTDEGDPRGLFKLASPLLTAAFSRMIKTDLENLKDLLEASG